MKPNALIRFYIGSAVAIFCFSIVAKVAAHYTYAELRLHDPFLRFLTVWQLLLVSIIIEALAIGIISANYYKSPNIAIGCVLWLTLLLILYRIGFLFSPDHTGTICKCFGGPGGIVGKFSDTLAWLLLIYLFILGAVTALWSSMSTYSRHVSHKKCSIA